MPVGLPDILSTDGKEIYMRSQRLDRDGKRLEVEPVSGDPVETGAAQQGEGIHLFAPLGFVDDSWFHRGYWVWGRRFAGGHAGYFQAGRFTPSGRLLAVDDDHVFGFARKPQYYRWTTILEHHLYAAPKTPPQVEPQTRRRGRGAAHVTVAKSDSLNPHNQDLVVETRVFAERPSGTVIAHGGGQNGYAIDFRQGRPRFLVRIAGKLSIAAARQTATRRWIHLVAKLDKSGKMSLYVNGKQVAQADAGGTPSQPIEDLQIGADLRSTVGNYQAPNGFGGVVDELAIYHGPVTREQIAARTENAKHAWDEATAVLQFSFDQGKAVDGSGKQNNGTVSGAVAVQGKLGNAMRFRNQGRRNNATYVRYTWSRDLPILVEAMVSAGDHLIVAGPPDVMDEEQTFEMITKRDPKVEPILKAQDEAWQGKQGSRVLVLSKRDGKTLQTIEIPELVRWDGLAVSNGCLYVTTVNGVVRCLTSPAE